MSAASFEAIRDWRELNLDQGGRSLIQASAGTGKTWTISVLYLRLLLEQELSPRRIVVTTFTNAAAAELRERLRARLLWAERRANSSDDSHLVDEKTDEAWLHSRWRTEPNCKVEDLKRLHVAIAELDMAPITTLHGLCQRILSDHPFAAGVAFDGGDLVGIDAMVGDIGKDLLRRFHQGDEETDALIRLQRDADIEMTQDGLTRRLKLLLMPGSVVHCLGDDEIAKLLPRDWIDKLRELSGFFSEKAIVRRCWQGLANLIDKPNSQIPDPAKFEQELRNSPKLTGVLKAHKDDPRLVEAAEFAVLCVGSGVLRHKEQKFWSAVADWAHAQVKSRLSNLNRRTFDGLLSTVSDALDGDGGRSLVDALFAAWPVALVDEFQDTDGVQYGILDRIYRDANHVKRGRLVMIGDPKQAIYRFRGGDIHAYLRAANEANADGRLTLARNRRSSRHFVAALNQFFELAGPRLSAEPEGDNILYEPVDSSDRQDESPYTIDGHPCEQPLVIHYRAEDPKSVSERRDLALQVCANQIAELLNSGAHRIGDKPVHPSDIAVLVPANHELNTLRDLLRERGVPSVTTARSSVFATAIARELQVVLHAVENCSDLRSVRAAVATRLWGMDYAALRRMDDEPAWQVIAGIFHDWRQRWHQRGVQAVVDALIERIAGEQLATVTGERTITDLRHLGELLQAQSDDVDGITELLAWFHDQREAHGDDNDEAADNGQLRIESDAQRVRLMTLHASKGLEYPIVFLPLLWDHGEKKDSTGLYQVAANDGMRRIELTELAKETEQLALQDERFRILYVALTRTVHACHVFALPVDRPATARSKSAACGTARSALDVMLGRMQPPISAMEVLRDTTPHILWKNGWRPAEAPQYAAIDEDSKSGREARTPLPKAAIPLPAKHSFTTLTQDMHTGELAPDASAEDENDTGDDDVALAGVAAPSPLITPEPASANDSHPLLLELDQVKGRDFGNAVHAIFEHRQPRVAFAKQSELVRRYLAEYNVRCRNGRDLEWLAKALIRRLQAVIDTPLGAAQGAGPRLADLHAADMRVEMEFHFALDGVSMHALRAACVANGEPGLVPLGNRRLAGLMNGKIDLVFRHGGRFHVLDYKGNQLGDRLDDYLGDALAARMDGSEYRFQALIYVVALDRYLRQRIRDYDRGRHLGDCYYIFIRAVGLGDRAGIWRHRFGDGLLDAVQEVFASTRKFGEAA